MYFLWDLLGNSDIPIHFSENLQGSPFIFLGTRGSHAFFLGNSENSCIFLGTQGTYTFFLGTRKTHAFISEFGKPMIFSGKSVTHRCSRFSPSSLKYVWVPRVSRKIYMVLPSSQKNAWVLWELNSRSRSSRIKLEFLEFLEKQMNGNLGFPEKCMGLGTPIYFFRGSGKSETLAMFMSCPLIMFVLT